MPTEQRPSRHRYGSTPERLSETPGLLMGTQHNPVEIESSPEPEITRSSPKKNKKNFYVVAAGHVPGIYRTWAEVEPLIKGYSGTKHKSFATEAEARAWLEENRRDPIRQYSYGGDVAIKPETSGRLHQNSAPAQSPYFAQEAANAYLPSARLHESVVLTGGNMQTLSDAADFMPPPPLTEPVGAPNTISTIESDPILKPEQQKVVDLILEGHNVFYTGSAGCGKSTILKAFVKQLQLRGKNVKIVAPTNLAALNVGGITTWSFAGWTPDSMKKSLDKLMHSAHGKEVWERFDKTDVLVIDEISMVENLLFERLNYIMKASIGERKGGGAFGGVQVIVTGDVSLHGR
jgi:ATP-dependent DNA helicase PIF1